MQGITKKSERVLSDILLDAIENRNNKRAKEALRAGTDPLSCRNKEGLSPRQRAEQIGWFGGAQLFLIEEQKRWLTIMHENPMGEIWSHYKALFLLGKYELQKWFSHSK